MNKQPSRRRTACRGRSRTLAIATAMAALVALLGAGQALAAPDERVLERQGGIDRQAAVGQDDEQGRVVLPPQHASEDKAALTQAERERSRQTPARFPRRYLPPEPSMSTESRLDIEQPAPVPPPAPERTGPGLAVPAALAALVLALAVISTWRIRRRPARPGPDPTT